jgi:DNA-binding transcriptional LysR family regulator
VLNLQFVETFLAVVRTGSFRRAGETLGYAQPTVSQHIKKLESALNVPLIVRRSNGCAPTAEAETFLPYAESLLRVTRQAESALAGRRLAVGASSNVGIYLLQPHLRRFQQSAPAATAVELTLGTNPQIAAKLEAAEVDVAVMEWWSDAAGYTARRWRREKLVVIVPPDHRWARLPALPAEDLRGAPMIGGEPGTGTGRILRGALGTVGRELRIVCELGSTEAVKQAVKAGRGVSIVFANAVVDEIKAGSLVALDLEGLDLAKDLYVAHRDNLPPTATARLFAGLLLDEATAAAGG